MPTKTFERLPAEKRRRFLDAAWAEFTRAPFAETSINRIVRQAEIPRGSFYQYFADKEELFTYLLESVKERFGAAYAELIRSQDGDLFRTQLAAYDRALDESRGRSPFLCRYAQLMRINPGMDLQKLIRGRPGERMVERLFAEVRGFPRDACEEPVIRQAFFLSLMALGASVADGLAAPEKREQYREELAIRLEIIRRGAQSAGAGRAGKEEL